MVHTHAHYHTNLISSLHCAVLTVSDTRDKNTDISGQQICKMLKENQHHIVQRNIVKDDAVEIAKAFDRIMALVPLNALIVNGGTGVAKRDVSVDTLLPRVDRELIGFGELFRWLSYQQIGSGAMLSRATAGVKGNKVVFMLPGSRKAVELAMRALILPELVHLVNELNK